MCAQYTSRAAQLYRAQLEKDAAKLSALPKPEALDAAAPAAAAAAAPAPAPGPTAVANSGAPAAEAVVQNGDAEAAHAGLENGAAAAAAAPPGKFPTILFAYLLSWRIKFPQVT